MTQQAAWPSEILDHRASQVIELVWADRCTRPTALRRPARRVSLRGVRKPAAQEWNDLAVAQDIALTTITPVGETGLQLHFSDGHERGIYPWAYLRELSLCAA